MGQHEDCVVHIEEELGALPCREAHPRDVVVGTDRLHHMFIVPKDPQAKDRLEPTPAPGPFHRRCKDMRESQRCDAGSVGGNGSVAPVPLRGQFHLVATALLHFDPRGPTYLRRVKGVGGITRSAKKA